MQFKKILLTVSFCLLCSTHLSSLAQTQAELFNGNTECQALMQKGNTLWVEGKLSEALLQFQEAGKADPKASAPWAFAAALFFEASLRAKTDSVAQYRVNASQLAKKALTLNEADPLAQETLRKLSTATNIQKTNIPQEAQILFNEAENLFQKRDFKAAREKYEAAFAKAPNYAPAILYAGDCYFQEGAFAEAETRYRQAVDLDPNHYQAWRFLAHAQSKMNRPIASIKLSLLRAIEAQPNYIPAWDWYAALSKVEGTSLITLRANRQANLKISQEHGKIRYNVELAQGASKEPKDEDAALWLAYAMSKANLYTEKHAAETSIFQKELKAWQTTFAIKAEMGTAELKDTLLVQFQNFAKEGQLEAAIFIFFFQEEFRTDFEIWKKTHPTGIQQFIDKFRVRPVAS